jgi:hypothetical protein
MTISIGIKVNDGLVIASDSAITLSAGTGVTNVYMNGNKIVNLHKNLPLAVSFWGLASISGHSTAFWLHELRNRFEGKSEAHLDWSIDEANYNLVEIANRVGDFFNQLISEQHIAFPAIPISDLGLLISGYSSGKIIPETQVVVLNSDKPKFQYDPIPAGSGWFSSGQPEAINRILNGYSLNLPQALINLKVDPSEVNAYVQAITNQTNIPLIQDAMPIQDAIDLAEFLADATIKFIKYAPGANTVDGEVEIATITRHEGFKWVRRKLYYPLELNGGRHE